MRNADGDSSKVSSSADANRDAVYAGRNCAVNRMFMDGSMVGMMGGAAVVLLLGAVPVVVDGVVWFVPLLGATV
jgi:hypothetical protein